MGLVMSFNSEYKIYDLCCLLDLCFYLICIKILLVHWLTKVKYCIHCSGAFTCNHFVRGLLWFVNMFSIVSSWGITSPFCLNLNPDAVRV